MLLLEPYNPSRKCDLSLESSKVSFFWLLHLRLMSLSVHSQSNISLNRHSCICNLFSRFTHCHFRSLAISEKIWHLMEADLGSLILLNHLSLFMNCQQLSAFLPALCQPILPEVDLSDIVPGGSFHGALTRHITKVKKREVKL